MKNIFRKNQVIITALVIMIAIAGYLNFTNDKTANQDGDNYAYTETSSNTTSDDASVDTDSLISSADLASSEYMADVSKDSEDLAADSENVSDDDVASADDANATTDISDEDIAANDDESIPVSDSGELVTDKTDDKTDSKDSTGEAVLVNSNLSSSYFSSAKLKREQSRAQQKDTLMGIINDENCTEDQKNEAYDSVIKMTETAEAESATESSIQARGFENVVVRIVNDSVEVIIGAKALTDQQVAQIEDIVKRNTQISVENITIIPVSVTED